MAPEAYRIDVGAVGRNRCRPGPAVGSREEREDEGRQPITLGIDGPQNLALHLEAQQAVAALRVCTLEPV